MIINNNTLDNSGKNTGIKINAIELFADQVVELKNKYGIEPVKGNYWYDTRSGAFWLFVTYT